jgi:hypothetical protein
MAKIDTSTIEGFDTMTPDQKVAALTGLDIPDPDYSGYVKKEVFDKTASEAAEWKKKHNALLSEDEQKKLANEQALAEMKDKLAGLEKEKTVSSYKATLIAQGYDEKLADETAQAMTDGDMAKVFVNQGKFLTEREKAIKAELLKKTPAPPAGGGGEGMTKEKFLKLSTKEQNEYIKDHPDWMTELK